MCVCVCVCFPPVFFTSRVTSRERRRRRRDFAAAGATSVDDNPATRRQATVAMTTTDDVTPNDGITPDDATENATTTVIMPNDDGGYNFSYITTPLNFNLTLDPPGAMFLNYSPAMTVLVAAFLGAFVLGTVFGNFLVVLSLYRYRYLRTVSNFLIGNLALSDFLLAVTVLPLSSVNESLGHWIFGKITCNIWLLTDVLCCTASIWNLCVIAFDRFTATLCPVWYREKRSSKQVVVYIGVVWVVSAIVCLPPVLGWNDLSDNYVSENSTGVYRCNLFQTPGYVIYSANGSFFLPFLLTLCLYVAIFATLRVRVQRMRRTDSTRGAVVVAPGLERHLGTERLLRPESKVADDDVTSKTEMEFAEPEPEPKHSSVFCPVALGSGIFGRKEGRKSKDSSLSPHNQPQYHPYTHDPHNPTASDPPLDRAPETQSPAAVKQPFTRRGTDRQPPLQRRSSSARRHEQREARATVRMAVIIATFCGMWLGFFVVYTVRGCCPDCPVPRELDAFFFWLGYSNSSVNPILYTIFNDDFKRAFAAILSRRHNASGRNSRSASTRRRSTLTSTISSRWQS